MLRYDEIDGRLCLYFSKNSDSGTAGDVERVLSEVPFGGSNATIINLSEVTSLDMLHAVGGWADPVGGRTLDYTPFGGRTRNAHTAPARQHAPQIEKASGKLPRSPSRPPRIGKTMPPTP